MRIISKYEGVITDINYDTSSIVISRRGTKVYMKICDTKGICNITTVGEFDTLEQAVEKLESIHEAYTLGIKVLYLDDTYKSTLPSAETILGDNKGDTDECLTGLLSDSVTGEPRQVKRTMDFDI